MTEKRPRHTPRVLVALRAPKTFNELERETRIPPSTLSRSLKVLVESEMIRTRPLSDDEEQFIKGLWKYELTTKGKDLIRVAENLEKNHSEFWTAIEG